MLKPFDIFLIYQYLIHQQQIKIGKSVLLAKSKVSTPVEFCKSAFVA